MKPLRFAIFGTGFWSRYQLAAWRELAGAECVALYNRTRAKAEALAQEFGIAAVYDDPEKLLANEQVDFIDIITDVGTHAPLVLLAADHQIPAICQKPMASDFQTAARMEAACRATGTRLFIHENWRWQAPIRAVKSAIDTGLIGSIHRARIDYMNSFPVFENQPFLKELEQFILTDIGSHILDVARFLFGEAKTLYCQTGRVHRDIKGEDVATVMMRMHSGATVTCNMSYASPVEHDRFPEAFIFIEGERGSIELGPDFQVRITTKAGTNVHRHPPPFFKWADPCYALVHASIVACNQNLLSGLQNRTSAETSGEDNLQTMKLVFAAYASAKKDEVIQLDGFN